MAHDPEDRLFRGRWRPDQPCGETLAGCTCQLPPDHPPPCVCPCGGSWERLGIQRDLIVHSYPDTFLDGPLADQDVFDAAQLAGWQAWCGYDAVAVPDPEHPGKHWVYGDRWGRIYVTDTGATMEPEPPRSYLLAPSLFGGPMLGLGGDW